MASRSATMDLPVTYQFSVEDFHRMGEAGIFHEDDRVELLDGEILAMTPIGLRHASCVDRLTARFAALIPRVVLRIQSPGQLDSRSEPLPDLQLLVAREDFYATHHPRPEEILLLVEVADSSLRFDREVKLPKYASSGIAEVWIIDLTADRVEIHREPGSEGYARSQVHCREAVVSPGAFPDFPVPLADVLPPSV